MAVPTTSNPMGGPLEIEINGVTIPDFMIGTVSPNVPPLLRTSERISGSTTNPTNQLDNPSYDVVFYPNQWSDLQYFFPENYVGTPGGTDGYMAFGGSSCELPEAVPVVFHYKCDDGETRDTSLPVAKVAFEDNGEMNATDDRSVTIHIYPQPNALGQVVYGPMPTS